MENLKRHEELTREEIVSMIGEKLVTEAENNNCDYTNTVGQNGENGYFGFSGFSSKITDPEDADYEVYVEVFYAVKNEEHNNNCEDLGGIDWIGSVDHYKILD